MVAPGPAAPAPSRRLARPSVLLDEWWDTEAKTMAIDRRSHLSMADSRHSLQHRAVPTPPTASSTSAMMSTTGVPVRENAKRKASHELEGLVVCVCGVCGVCAVLRV